MDTSEQDDDDGDGKQGDKVRRRLVICSALYIPLFAGAFFGWGPMELMLEENGAFEEKCESDEELPCPAQTTRLLNVQLVALLTMIFAPLFGILSDKFGAVALMWFTATCGVLGLTVLMIAASLGVDNLLYLAFILLACMAVSSSIMIIQTGLIFQNKRQQRVISVLNVLYDAGALVYLALWGITELTGASLAVVVGFYLAVAVLVFACAVYLWRIVIPVAVHSEGSIDNEKQEAALAVDVSTATQNDSHTISEISELPQSVCSEEKDKVEEKSDSSEKADASDHGDIEPSTATDDTNKSLAPTNDYVLIADRPPLQQLLSKQYITLLVFFSVLGARNVFTLTTARDFLAYLGDDETGNKYLTIFTLLTPASIAGLPFMDWIVNHCGYHAAFQSINVLALLHGIIQVSSENLNVQVLGFVVFSFFRCFLFTIVFSFLPTFMGIAIVGRAAGIVTCAFGALCFINIPLASLAVNQFDGNFFWPNLFYTLVVIPLIYAAWIMGQGIRKEKEVATAREGKTEEDVDM